MNATFTTQTDGGPWNCPYCNQPTETMYRCSNRDCGRDLTKDELEPIGSDA